MQWADKVHLDNQLSETSTHLNLRQGINYYSNTMWRHFQGTATKVIRVLKLNIALRL